MYKVFPPYHSDGLFWPTVSAARAAMHTPKFRVAFIFPVDDLMKMAANLAFIQGNAITDAQPDMAPAIRQFYDILESGNAPVLQAQLDLTLSEIEDALSAISAGHLDGNRHYDVHVQPKQEFVSEFYISADTADSTIQHLALAMQDCLISSILSKWSALTNSQTLAYWDQQQQVQMEAIRSAGIRCQPKNITVRKFPAW